MPRLTPFVLLACMLIAETAAACVMITAAYRPSFWHRLIDHRAPTAPKIITEDVAVQRGIGPRPTDRPNTFYSTSCDDIGFFSVEIQPGSDNRTDVQELGYVFEVVEGTAPVGLFETDPIGAPPPDMRPGEGKAHRLTLGWIDGATNEQEPLWFAFVVRAVDRARNRSTPSDTLLVKHPGYGADDQRADDQRISR